MINEWLERALAVKVNRVRSIADGPLLEDARLFDYLGVGKRENARCDPPIGKVSCFQFGLGPDSIHPWVVAVRRAVAAGDRSVVRSVLDAYYSTVNPGDAAEWLDIPAGSAPALAERSPVAAVLPWSMFRPEEEADRQESIHRRENEAHGLSGGVSRGAKAFGPIDDGRLAMETGRLWDLVGSIARIGLDTTRRDYSLSGDFLIDGSRFAVLVRGGGHRAAVASALGIERIPMRVSTLVRRDEAAIWPQVVSGVYDEATALRVFDRLLSGEPPSVAASWLDHAPELGETAGQAD